MKSRVSSRERDFTSSSARVIRTPVAKPRLRSQRAAEKRRFWRSMSHTRARNQDAGPKAAAEITKGGGKATFLEIDVANDANVTTAAREFAKVADHLDVLVNHAGILVD